VAATMTKDEHLKIWREESENARKTLETLGSGVDLKMWRREYMYHIRQAKKHYGIAQAMLTKEMKKEMEDIF
jgi:ribosome-binding protein aMBF1 (putative translation factor)